MLGSKARWQFAVCVVSVPVIVLAGGCSSSGPSSGPSGQAPTSHQAAPGSAGADQTPAPNASAPVAPSPAKVTSGILALNSVGNKRIYAFIDPNSGQYSEAVTFTIPSTGSVQGSTFPRLAASPDLTKLAVSSMANGQLMAGWIDSSGQFTAVTTAADGVRSGEFRRRTRRLGSTQPETITTKKIHKVPCTPRYTRCRRGRRAIHSS
jgi:hypothetical protein